MSKVITKPIKLNPNELLEVRFSKSGKFFTKKSGKDLLVFEEGIDTPIAVYENYELSMAPVDLASLPHYAELATGIATDAVVGSSTATGVSAVAAGTAAGTAATGLSTMAMVGIGAVGVGGAAVAVRAARNGSGGDNNALIAPTDTTAPTVAIISSGLTNDPTPTLTGTAEEGSTVTVVIAGATYTTTATGGLWSVDTATAIPTSGILSVDVNGNNSISVTATDKAGNSTVAPTTQILELDTTPPDSIAASEFVINDIGISITDGITLDPTLTLTLSADTANWQYSLDNGTTWINGTGNTITLPEGIYDKQDVQVKQFDAAGNFSVSQMSIVSDGMTIDTIAPTVAITSFALTNDPAPIISGTAETGATVVVVITGATYIATASGGVWSIDTATATPNSGTLSIDVNGSNSISVSATDVAGNTSAAVTQTLVLDTTVPIVTITSSALTNDVTPIISGTAEEGSVVTIVIAGATYTTIATSGVWSIDTGSAVPISGILSIDVNGNNSVSVSAVDSAGNASVSTAIQTLVIDTTPPIATITSSALTNDATPIISGTAEADSIVTVVIAGAAYTTIATGGIWSIDTGTATPASGTLSIDLNGNNSVSVTAVDSAGNPTVVTQTLIVDTVAPATIDPSAFVFTDTGASPTDGVSNNPTLTLTLASDTDTWQYSLDNGTTWTNGSGNTITLPEGQNDKRNVQVKQFDAAGNSSISEMDIAPTLPTYTMVQLNATNGIYASFHTITSVGTTGEYAVAFSDITNQYSVFVQKFNADGTTAGSMVQIDTGGSVFDPKITAVGTLGAYVVAIYGQDSVGTDDSIFVQKFNADGTTAGAMVNLVAIGRANGVAKDQKITAVGTDGEYLVSFSAQDSDGDYSIFMQKFNVDGTIQGSMVQFEAIGNTTGDDESPTIITVGTTGEYVLTFYGHDSAGDLSIFVQKFNANGTAEGSMVQLEAIGNSTGNDVVPLVAEIGTTGEYVVTFWGIDSAGDYSVFIQKFNSDGTTAGSMVQLEAIGNTTGSDLVTNIVAIGNTGEYVVTFFGIDSTGDKSVFVQKFNSDGSTVGSMVQLEAIANMLGTDQFAKTTAIGTLGEYIVTFQGTDSMGDQSIFIQKFNADGTTAGSMVQLEAIGVINGHDKVPQITAVGTLGDYVVTFYGINSVGNTSVYVQKFNADGSYGTVIAPYNAMIIDTTPCAVSITSSSLSDITPVLAGTADAGATVSVVIAGATYTTTAINGVWSVDTATAIPTSGALNMIATNTVSVTATDSAGNPTLSPVTQTLTLDATSPAIIAPSGFVITDTGSSATDNITTNGTITLTLASDTTRWEYSINGAIWTNGSGNTIALAQGFYDKNNILIQQFDAVGNSSISAMSAVYDPITIDTTRPIPTITSPTFFNTATQIITGTCDEDATVLVTIRGSVGATYTTTAVGGVWSVDTATAIPTSGTPDVNVNGYNDIRVSAVDLAGNITLTSEVATQIFVVDIPPVIIAPSGFVITDTGISATDGITSNPNLHLALSGDVMAQQYSLDNGLTWTSFNSLNLTLPDGTYDKQNILIKQFDAAGTSNISYMSTTPTLATTMVQLEAIGRTNGDDYAPQITAVGTAGAYVVTFQGVDSAGDDSIFVQKFNADGTTAGAMVQLEAIGRTNSADQAPQITAVGTAGEYVVTFSGLDSAGDQSIFVQKFNADGTITGSMVKLEAYVRTDGFDVVPQIIAVGTAGEFVVTFEGQSNGFDQAIYIQKFNASGAPVGAMIKQDAIANASGYDASAQITSVGTSGEYVLTFYGRDSADLSPYVNDYSIYIRKFNADGTIGGPMVQLEAIGVNNGHDQAPQITSVGTIGEYVVTFSGLDNTGDGSVFVQKFNANSTTAGSMVKLEAIGVTNNNDGAPQITAVGTAGEYVVTFTAVDSTGHYSIFVQKFNTNGTVAGSMVKLEAISRIDGNDGSPQITAVGTMGEYVVTFSGLDSAGDGSVFVQKFNADGTIAGSMVQLEAIGVTNDDDGTPQVTAVGTTGEYVVTFTAVDNMGDSSIFVQKFNADGTIVEDKHNILIVDTTIVFSSSSTVTTPENVATTTVVYDAQTTEIDAGMRYSISGLDVSKFTIDTITGEVKFVTSPNYELPTDRGTDNTYDFTVHATDTAGNIVDQAVALSVTDPFILSGTTVTSNGISFTLGTESIQNGQTYYFVTDIAGRGPGIDHDILDQAFYDGFDTFDTFVVAGNDGPRTFLSGGVTYILPTADELNALSNTAPNGWGTGDYWSSTEGIFSEDHRYSNLASDGSTSDYQQYYVALQVLA